MTVLAIDQGTSATKAIVLADDGSMLALAEAPISISATPDRGVELDPTELWDSVGAAGRRALAEAGHPALDAIGLANQGETILAWDRATGAAHGPAIVWQDRRSGVVCDRLAEHADELAELTGLELDPYFVAPKMVWLAEQIEREHGNTAISPSPPPTPGCCTGCAARFATDVATAGRSLLLDLDTRRVERARRRDLRAST